MFRCRVFLAGVVATVIVSGTALAESPNFDEFAVPGLGQRMATTDRELLALAEQVAAATGTSTGRAMADLELHAVYHGLYLRPWKPDYAKVPLARPGPDFGGPGVSLGPLYSLAQVDAAIREDEAFLVKGNNNPANEEFVKKRLVELRAIRSHVADVADAHIQNEIKKGDPLLTEHFNGVKMLEVDPEAKAAAARLGKPRADVSSAPDRLAAFNKAKADFGRKFAEQRDLKFRDRRLKARGDLHKALADTISREELDAPSAGDFAVVAAHVHCQYYGGFGSLSPGKETQLGTRDYYFFVVDEEGVLAGRIKEWETKHDYDWCLGTSDGVVPSFIRSSLTLVAHYNGFEKRRAEQIRQEMAERGQSRGLTLGNLGWLGPLHGTNVPFTIPESAANLGKCN
ncbi:MAG: hypothetical protein WD069_19905 [Planctomycetales bacterium]